jgi:hypothetical protein
MPSSSRWRGSRIVGPLDPNRERELVGGLQNAVAREKAKQSFINAGYTPQEIETAIAKVNTSTTKQAQPKTATTLTKNALQTKALPTATSPTEKKGLSKKLIIIISVVAVLILVTAGVLGFFWDNLFG